MTSPRFERTARLLAAGLAVVATAALVACGGDDDDDDAEADVQAAYDSLQSYGSPEEAAALVSEDFFDNAFAGFLTAEEVFSNPAPVLTDIEISVDGDTATLDGIEASEDVEGQSAAVRWTFVKDGEEWKLDDIEPRDFEPDDTTNVDAELVDFAFDFDEDDFKSGEPIAITAENTGEQPHIVVLVKVDEGVNLQEALESESEEQPEGITTILDYGLWNPGDSGTVFTTQELEAGNYALICFLPDLTDPENKPPHFAQGMLSEFTVE